jgi:hypothetical protein
MASNRHSYMSSSLLEDSFPSTSSAKVVGTVSEFLQEHEHGSHQQGCNEASFVKKVVTR